MKTDRGPFLLPSARGHTSDDSALVYLSWHFEQPDSVICIDKALVWDKYTLDYLTDEQNDSLVEQIKEYLEALPPPYTGD